MSLTPARDLNWSWGAGFLIVTENQRQLITWAIPERMSVSSLLWPPVDDLVSPSSEPASNKAALDVLFPVGIMTRLKEWQC